MVVVGGYQALFYFHEQRAIIGYLSMTCTVGILTSLTPKNYRKDWEPSEGISLLLVIYCML